MLVYVYPLRMVVSSGLSFMTGGRLPSQMELRSVGELQDCFLIFGLGFNLSLCPVGGRCDRDDALLFQQ